MLTAALSLSSLAYQLGAPSVRADAARASACVMENRLNNYILDGPLQPLGNQVGRPARLAVRGMARTLNRVPAVLLARRC